MELQLVSFVQAKTLKEVGYPQNIYTPKVYLEKTIPHDIIAKECGLGDWQCIGGKLIPCSSDYNKYGVDTCSCPTLELVARWLMQEHGFIFQILPITGWVCRVQQFDRPFKEYIYPWENESLKYSYEFPNVFDSYEEALSAYIDKALEILKSNEQTIKDKA